MRQTSDSCSQMSKISDVVGSVSICLCRWLTGLQSISKISLSLSSWVHVPSSRWASMTNTRNSTAERPVLFTARSPFIHSASTLVPRRGQLRVHEGGASRVRIRLRLGQDGIADHHAGVEDCALDVLLGIVRLDVQLVGGVLDVVADGGLRWWRQTSVR